MRTYRLTWLMVCTVLACLGVLVSLAVSPAMARDVAVAAAVVGGLGALTLWRVSEHEPGETCGGLLARGAAGTAVAGTAAVGLALALGGGFLPVVLFLVLTSPRAVATCGRWLASAPRITTADLGAALVATAWASPGFVPLASEAQELPLRLLTGEELCQRWRASGAQLSARGLDAVEERLVLLAELERRNPSGFTAWLVSGAPPETLLARPPASLEPAHAVGRGTSRRRFR
jgi:hypothetical protein